MVAVAPAPVPVPELITQNAHRQYLQTRYFGALDGLRCIAILAVIWVHSGAHVHTLANQGHYGVELFFAISGFLITTLLLRDRAGQGAISLQGFYMRRTLRIFPLYYGVLALYCIIVYKLERNPEDAQEFWRRLPWYATYTSNWLIDGTPIGRKIFYFAWSLATEEQFYLVWPWIVAFSRGWRIPVLALIAALLLDQATEFAIARQVFPPPYPMPVRVLAGISTPICLGCLLAFALHSSQGFRRLYHLLAHPITLPLLIGMILLLLSSYRTPPLLVHLAMAALVGAACVAARPPFLLANPAVRYIGIISYGMYLLHMLAMQFAKRVPGVAEAGNAIVFIVGTALAILFASISYWTYERWFLRLKNSFRGQRAPVPAASESSDPLASPAVPSIPK
jgi:peptidoglycan/LPS O-acetylase OafA/YrhL